MNDIQLIEVKKNKKNILKKLIQLYMYDFSEITGRDIDEKGEFKYRFFDLYWEEKSRKPFFIVYNKKIVGFILVNENPVYKPKNKVKCIAEFFVLKKYRNQKIGSEAAKTIFNKFQGEWEVFTRKEHTKGIKFWERVITEVSKNKVEEFPFSKKHLNLIVFRFES